MKRKRVDISIIVVLVIAAVVAALWITNSSRLDKYAEDPQEGDIYILYKEDIYSPMKVMEVSETEISFYQYMFSFGEACPDREQLLESEWMYSLKATYTRKEINKMYESGEVVEIYRDE